MRGDVFSAEDLGLPEAVNWTLEPGATFARIPIPLPAGDLGEVIRRLREEGR